MANVRDFGAVGDGVVDDTTAIQDAVDACFGPATAPHGTASVCANKPLYFPSGNYRITAPIKLTKVVGGHVYGDGRQGTKIKNTAGGGVFVTNGCSRSVFELMTLSGIGTGTIFDLDWDNSPGGNALQSNTFRDMDFEFGDYGLRQGASGYMGSETLIQNCFFKGHTVAGISTENYNALQTTVIGGNIASCGIGIRSASGSAPVITGVGFQINTEWDIWADNSSGDCVVISGCRTESPNFAYCGKKSLLVQGCSQRNPTPGIFVKTGGYSAGQLQNCISLAGKVDLGIGGVVTCSEFGRDDWLEYRRDRIYTTKLTTGKTGVGTGTGTQKRYERGYWYQLVYTDQS